VEGGSWKLGKDIGFGPVGSIYKSSCRCASMKKVSRQQARGKRARRE
jgi:hypothetical protein